MNRARFHILRGSFRTQRRYRLAKLRQVRAGLRLTAKAAIRRQWGLFHMGRRFVGADLKRVLAGPVRTNG